MRVLITKTFDENTQAYIPTKAYSIRDTAEKTGYSVRTIRAFIVNGDVDAVKRAGRWYIIERKGMLHKSKL